MRRWIFSIGLVCAALVLTASPAFAATVQPQTTIADIPLQRTVFVSCAHSGAGDTVTLDGRLHTLLTTVTNAGGDTVVHEAFSPMGVRGIGLNGEVYRGGGVTSTIEMNAGSRTEFTFRNVFMVVGPGRGNNLIIRALTHFGIAPDGVMRPFVSDVTIDCA